MLIKTRGEKICLIALIFSYAFFFLLGFYWNKTSSIELRSSETFRQVGLKYRTDKVTDHGYERIYEKYLQKYRGKNVSLLEIGLRCGMPYGPGASAHLWRTYFGALAKIHFIEFNEKCGRDWFEERGRKLNVTISYGSQDDVTFVTQFSRETEGYFDLIVEDGGHTMNEQITSLVHLIDKVRSGGSYVIEDLQTSYFPHLRSHRHERNATTLEFIQQLLNEVQK